MRKHGFWMMAILAGVAGICSPARADDERGRWSLSFGGGVLSTKDDIRSNAAALLVLPFGRPNDISDDKVVNNSIDPRQDDLLSRATAVEERQTYTLSAAYGLTPWLSVQIDVGHYSGNISNLDTFRVDRYFFDADHNNIIDPSREFFSTSPHDASVPISAGRLREIPLSLSALFRFRKDSPFNPILGGGVGMIFTDFRESAVLHDLNNQILQGFQRTQVYDPGTGPQAFNRQIIADRFGQPIANTTCTVPANTAGLPENACTLGIQRLQAALANLDPNDPAYAETAAFLRQSFAGFINQPFLPQRPFVTTQVDNAFEYHFTGGAEYHFNDHWSAYFLGRYLFTKSTLQIRISDNGNLVTRSATGDASQRITFQTDQARFSFLSGQNCDIVKNQQTPCVLPPNGQALNSDIIVQGGKINLSGFTLGFGMRYTF